MPILPVELIIEILCFNPEHREHFNPVLKEIKNKYYIRYADTWYEKGFYLEKPDYPLVKDHVNFWSRCTCCQRHSQNKLHFSKNDPRDKRLYVMKNAFSKDFDNYTNPTLNYSNCPVGKRYLNQLNNICNCLCRHIPRRFVRKLDLDPNYAKESKEIIS